MVVDNHGQVEGMLTGADSVTIVARSEPKAETTVERYTIREVVGVGPQDPTQHAADTVVTDAVVGMLSTADLTASLSGIREPSPA